MVRRERKRFGGREREAELRWEGEGRRDGSE